jgi:hypothetical protein
MAEKEARPNPLEGGQGRIDEVDQSKGIFRPDGRHPKDAEWRSPGSLGGPYEESGRGGIDPIFDPAGLRPPVDPTAFEPANVTEEQRPEPKEPAGVLPPHQGERK